MIFAVSELYIETGYYLPWVRALSLQYELALNELLICRL